MKRTLIALILIILYSTFIIFEVHILGCEKSLRHENIEILSNQLQELEVKVEEANRQLSGYLNLPPSLDLARVEVTKASNQLRSLSAQVERSIQSMHL